MALITFIDSAGAEWSVWDVRVDARAGTGGRSYLGAMQRGWLCFENGDQRRRTTEYPEHWEGLSSVELEKLCKSASPVVRRQTQEMPAFVPNPDSDVH